MNKQKIFGLSILNLIFILVLPFSVLSIAVGIPPVNTLILSPGQSYEYVLDFQNSEEKQTNFLLYLVDDQGIASLLNPKEEHALPPKTSSYKTSIMINIPNDPELKPPKKWEVRYVIKSVDGSFLDIPGSIKAEYPKSPTVWSNLMDSITGNSVKIVGSTVKSVKSNSWLSVIMANLLVIAFVLFIFKEKLASIDFVQNATAKLSSLNLNSLKKNLPSANLPKFSTVFARPSIPKKKSARKAKNKQSNTKKPSEQELFSSLEEKNSNNSK